VRSLRTGMRYNQVIYTFSRFVTGHEFAGEVVALGSSFGPNADGSERPTLYSTLKEGDKVVATFSTSCCECQYVYFVVVARFVLM
jgi:D-arabinose 1-dehydrogenase-like Zn-dependent alcohol dehydrogenase